MASSTLPCETALQAPIRQRIHVIMKEHEYGDQAKETSHRGTMHKILDRRVRLLQVSRHESCCRTDGSECAGNAVGV